jgi:membrane fusion protein (multidrug efflux system)
LNLSLNASDHALAVPSQALIPSSGGYTVYRARKSKVEAVPVETGQRGAGAVEITNGLNKGDTVITSNLLRLTPGAAIQFVTVK